MTNRELWHLLSQNTPRLRDAWLSTLPEREELPQYPTSPGFERKLERLTRQSRQPRWHRAALRYARQAAVIALIMLTVTFSGLMITSEAFRTQVLNVVMEVRESLGLTEFRFEYNEESGYLTEDRKAGDFVLTYLPKGMEEVEREIDHPNCYMRFEDGLGNFINFDHTVIGEKTSMTYGIDTEDAKVCYFKIGGNRAMAVIKKGMQGIVWSEENSVFILSSTLPMEELKQVALGLK